MKTYSSIVTILLVLSVAYQGFSYLTQATYFSEEVAVFSDSKKRPDMFKLSYKKNGDLIFSTVKLKSSLPSITHWDYYGSTEVVSYEWENSDTISIKTKDSTIRIVVPEFEVSSY